MNSASTRASATEDAHLRILKILAAEPEISQRQLAARLGISLGKTNFLLNSLLQKGLIKLGNFSRAERKFKYMYLLTPRGFGERVRLTRAYLERKEAEYEALQKEIKILRFEISGHSFNVGPVRDAQFNICSTQKIIGE